MIKAYFQPVLLSLCVVVGGVSGCSKGSKTQQHEPSKLPTLTHNQTLTPVFRQSIAGGSKVDPLRLQMDATDQAIYAVSRSGKLSAYQLNGKILWQSQAHQQEKNLTSGVTAGEGLVVAGSGKGILYALDAATGRPKWQSQLTGSILAPALIHQGRVITYTNDGTVYGVDTGNGSVIWTFATSAPQLSVRGTAAPVLTPDGTVVIASSNGYVYGLEPRNGIPRWQRRVAVSEGRSEVQRLIDIDADPVVVDNTLYNVSYQGQVTAVDLDTQRVKWSQDTSSLRQVAVGNGLVFVATSDGKLQAFRQDTGEPAWEQTALAYRQLSNPVVLGQHVVVGDFAGYLHLIDPATGTLRGRVQSKGEIRTIRVISNRLYVASRTGQLSVWQAS